MLKEVELSKVYKLFMEVFPDVKGREFAIVLMLFDAFPESPTVKDLRKAKKNRAELYERLSELRKTQIDEAL